MMDGGSFVRKQHHEGTAKQINDDSCKISQHTEQGTTITDGQRMLTAADEGMKRQADDGNKIQ